MIQIDNMDGFKVGKRYLWSAEIENDDTWHNRIYKPCAAGLMHLAFNDGYKYYSTPKYEDGSLVSYGLDEA